MSATTTYTGQCGVPHDLAEWEAEYLLLESARAALADAPPGDWTIVGMPHYERRGPHFVGGTIWGQDEDGAWIGDPRDYRLYIRLKVRSETATEAPTEPVFT